MTMLERLVDALQRAGVPMAVEDLQDILWLAARLPEAVAAPAVQHLSSSASPPETAQPPVSSLPSSVAPPSTPAVLTSTPGVDTTSLYAGTHLGHIRAGVLRVPGVSSTPPAVALRRALQPFAHRVPSDTRWQLDEERTAEWRAESGQWQLQYQRVCERWFDLQVVIDSGMSMDLWQPELNAFVRGLRGQGGFRSVQTFVLAGSMQAQLSHRPGGSALLPSALAAPGLRPVTLLVTDAGSALWLRGAGLRWLWAAAAVTPLVVLQLLPSRAWRHTALGEPATTVHWPRAGLPNTQLQASGDELDETPSEPWRAVPLLGFDAASVQRLARAITARGGASLPATWVTNDVPNTPHTVSAPTSARERVAQYRRKVSRAAYELAVFLSVPDPLTVPVMRLVQRTMLPNTSTAELAEFFLGGLLIPMPSESGCVWRLRDGVREELIRSLRYSEEGRIAEQLRRVGHALEQAEASIPVFEAWFPTAEGGASLSEWALPFASTSREILCSSSRDEGEAGVVARPDTGLWRTCFAASPDGKTIVAGTAYGTLQLWGTQDLKRLGIEISAHTGPVTGVSWVPNEAVIVSVGADGTVHVWDLDRERHSEQKLAEQRSALTSVAVSPDGSAVAVGDEAGTVTAWNRHDGQQLAKWISGQSYIKTLCFSASADAIWVVDGGGSIKLWSLRAGSARASMEETSDLSCIIVAGEGHLLVSGTKDGTLQVNDANSGLQLGKRKHAQEGAVLSLCVHGADCLASLGKEGLLHFWHLPSLEPEGEPVVVGKGIETVMAVPGVGIVAAMQSGELRRVAPPPVTNAEAASTTLPGRSSNGDVVLIVAPVDKVLDWVADALEENNNILATIKVHTIDQASSFLAGEKDESVSLMVLPVFSLPYGSNPPVNAIKNAFDSIEKVRKLRARLPVVIVLESLADQLVADFSASKHVYATTRDRLNAESFETPLESSASMELLDCSSVAQFVHHARAVNPGFPLDEASLWIVGSLCRLLGGRALSIELVASRADVLEVRQMLDTLEQWKAQAAGVDAAALNEQTILTWSTNLLHPVERQFFFRLAAFSSGFTADAALAACAEPGARIEDVLPMLDHLLKCRLITDSTPPGNRYSIEETAISFARERLDSSDETSSIMLRHALYFTSQAESLEHHLRGSARAAVLATLTTEHENIRAAFRWLRADAAHNELALRLGGALFWFWNFKGLFSEGLDELHYFLGHLDRVHSSETEAKATWAAGGLHFMRGDIPQAEAYLRTSVQIWERICTPDQPVAGLAYAKVILGRAIQDYKVALECEMDGLRIFQLVKDRWGEALAWNDLGYIRIANWQLVEARKSFQNSIAIWEQLNDTWGLPLALSNLGFFACYVALDEELASEALNRALEIQLSATDAWGVAETLKYLAELHRRKNQLDDARRRFSESLRLHDKLGRKQLVVDCLLGLARVAVDRALDIEEQLQAAGAPTFDSCNALLSYAVELFAAGTHHVIASRHPLPQTELSMNMPFCERARKRLGDEKYELRWNSGTVQSLHDAVNRALTLNEPALWQAMP